MPNLINNPIVTPNCPTKYFQNGLSVGHLLSAIQMTEDADNYYFKAFRPFLMTGFFSAILPENPLFLTRFDPYNNNGYYQLLVYLQQAFMESNRDGQDSSGYVTYEGEFENYFQYYMNNSLLERNYNSFLYPSSSWQKFWSDLQLTAPINSENDIYNEAAHIFKNSDLRIWLAPGLYTISKSSTFTGDLMLSTNDTHVTSGTIDIIQQDIDVVGSLAGSIYNPTTWIDWTITLDNGTTPATIDQTSGLLHPLSLDPDPSISMQKWFQDNTGVLFNALGCNIDTYNKVDPSLWGGNDLPPYPSANFTYLVGSIGAKIRTDNGKPSYRAGSTIVYAGSVFLPNLAIPLAISNFIINAQASYLGSLITDFINTFSMLPFISTQELKSVE